MHGISFVFVELIPIFVLTIRRISGSSFCRRENVEIFVGRQSTGSPDGSPVHVRRRGSEKEMRYPCYGRGPLVLVLLTGLPQPSRDMSYNARAFLAHGSLKTIEYARILDAGHGLNRDILKKKV